ncbi:MinD/ParA family ATP-binding protein [Arthrobacter rhizosphaerae]|uniref:MinD/ParA family ATP-binding protein n=1 Tax=Arthrobacter rhizosphaerae TaxID=2855490 RepID=UPI001FF0FD03|nr:MinD/ParA family protein [Arthrobacter rhizosphaerae]
MTETNTPKPTPRPVRSPRSKAAAPQKPPAKPPAKLPPKPEPIPAATEDVASTVAPETSSPPVSAPEAGTSSEPEASSLVEGQSEPAASPALTPMQEDEISVVTVAEGHEISSADSLGSFTPMSVPATTSGGMPSVTAGPFQQVTSEVAPAANTSLEAPPAEAPPAESPPAETPDDGSPGERNNPISERRERAEGPESAASLTADRLLNKTAAEPVGGWRLWLYKATLGYVNLGDSDRVRIQRATEHRIAARLGERTRYVPVLSRKGGVGKTTVTTLLGMVLAELREDRVIALDANPDRGTLSDRSPGRADFTARQLVKDRFTVDSFAQLSNYTARDGSRLDILASDADPMVAHAFDDADYRAVTDILGRYYSIVLTDSGTGMVHSVMKGTLEKADAVVLVSGGSVDEARLASETLSWLEAHGRHDLVAKATVVINMAAGAGTLVNVDEIEQHFLSRVKNVVRIPHDRHLAEGSKIDLRQLRPATRAAAVELAALVVEELQQS